MERLDRIGMWGLCLNAVSCRFVSCRNPNASEGHTGHKQREKERESPLIGDSYLVMKLNVQVAKIACQRLRLVLSHCRPRCLPLWRRMIMVDEGVDVVEVPARDDVVTHSEVSRSSRATSSSPRSPAGDDGIYRFGMQSNCLEV